MLCNFRRQKKLSFARLAAQLAAILWLVQTVAGQELSIFALQGPGQASTVVDRSTKTAHIIDLGRDGDGDELLLDGKPLLDALQSPEYEVNRLTITCSHPHADHHGGIRAMLKNPRNFVRDGRLLFGAKIPIIESAMPPAGSLSSILNSTGKAIGVTAQSREGRKAGAYDGFSKPGDEVFIESMPYTPRDQGGAHGRSIVTKVTLGGKHIHLDFDDADTVVIREVTAKLKEDGVRIDSFVVPHHGSAAHDIDPILELRRSPEARLAAVISVDPRNKYGHPAPEILAQLMRSVGKENVVLTGSRPNDRVVITPEGVTRAPYTAAMRDVFALFVVPAMARSKATRSAAMKTAYDEIWEMMSSGKKARRRILSSWPPTLGRRNPVQAALPRLRNRSSVTEPR
jgi:beta-lactamase superfamily II metal-dependent hydrolase